MLPDQRTRRTTTSGEIIGGVGTQGSGVWLGIPYASPPLGDLRWKAPRPAAAWTGVREMVRQKPPCAQPGPMPLLRPYDPDADFPFIGSEDCLYLNVWGPLTDKGDAGAVQRRPVMFWIHGGGNVSHDCAMYDGGVLVDHGVVFVTLNYRLGALGYFSHPALREADSEADRAANFGLLDIIQALQWVRDNIRNFGGDPDNVTIFGASAGGTNVLALVASPLAQGLFHKAIAQSGTISATSQERAERYFDDDRGGLVRSSAEVLVQLLINDRRADGRDAAKRLVSSMTSAEILSYLRDKSPSEIHRTYSQLIQCHKKSPRVFESMTARTHQTLILDEVVLPKHGLLEEFASRRCVPVMLGTTRDEDNLMLVEDTNFVSYSEEQGLSFKGVERFRVASALMSTLWKANGVDGPAAALSVNQPAVYAYRLDWDEVSPFSGPDREPYGAAHGVDAIIFFGIQVDGLTSRGDHPALSGFGRAMYSYWLEFAKSGAPGTGRGQDLPRWLPWRADGTEGHFMILDSVEDGGCRMATGVATKATVLETFRRDSRIPAQEKRGFLEMLLHYRYHWARLTVEDVAGFTVEDQ